jgi:hypothetical protein
MRQDELSAGEHRFIDAMGTYFERQGVPRIGGRILGLLMLAREPLALGRVAALLQVSPASVSTNMRPILAGGLAELATVPGDRRHYYVFSQAGWEGHLRFTLEGLMTFSRLCGQAAAAPDVRNKQRLREAVDFTDYFQRELTTMVDRWRARAAALPASNAASPSPRARRTSAR